MHRPTRSLANTQSKPHPLNRNAAWCRDVSTRRGYTASTSVRGIAAGLLIALLLTLPACTCQTDAPSDASVKTAVHEEAEAIRDEHSPTTAAAAAASSNAEADEGGEREKMDDAREPRTEKELRGAWLLDRQATIENMSLIQQKSVGPIVEEMTVALTFGPDGTLAVRGVAMGIAQEQGGHYEVLDIADQVLRVRIFREPVRGDDGEVIQPGSTLNMHAEFLDDDTLRWAPDDGQEDVQKPGEIRTLILARNEGDLEERFQRALEYDGGPLED